MNNRYFQTPPVVLNLLIINALIFMATALLPVGPSLLRTCSLHWFANPLFHAYQFVTYMFLHANFEHSWSTTWYAAWVRR